jgi:hypothetical protein
VVGVKSDLAMTDSILLSRIDSRSHAAMRPDDERASVAAARRRARTMIYDAATSAWAPRLN